MRHLIALAAVVAACHSSTAPEDNDPFDTFQACFDEHHKVENFDTQHAIEVCCIDHPIGSAPMNVVCGDTATSCEAYVDANLAATDATADDITTACEDYVVQRHG
jgi:hypothetical protein